MRKTHVLARSEGQRLLLGQQGKLASLGARLAEAAPELFNGEWPHHDDEGRVQLATLLLGRWRLGSKRPVGARRALVTRLFGIPEEAWEQKPTVGKHGAPWIIRKTNSKCAA